MGDDHKALVERLRAPAFWMCESMGGHPGESAAPYEAAAAIESLAAERDAARERAEKDERECEILRWKAPDGTDLKLAHPSRPFYHRAQLALEAAHHACFLHPDRPGNGMTCGPFSGVSEALGIVDLLEMGNAQLRAALAAAQAEASKAKAALEWASDFYGRPDIDHETYRVEMSKRADEALGRPDYATRMLNAIFPSGRAALAQGGRDDG